MESPAHAWEILSIAVRGLATGTGRLAERLRSAYTDGLHQLRPEHFPWDDLRDPLRDILDYFGADRGQGRLIIEGLSEDDQRRVAGEIFDLYVEATERHRYPR